MPAGSVGVAVLLFFGGGVANGDDHDIEMQCLAGEGVVAIDRHGLIVYFGDGDVVLVASRASGLELHSLFDLLHVGEG